MQEFSSLAITPPYDGGMQTGRPAKQPRTPFGERLHAAREAAGLSQAHVAEQMKVAQSAYAMWERRTVALKPEQIATLAELFNVPVEHLFGRPITKSQRGGPVGRLRRVFADASKLPRHQQNKVVEFVQAFVSQHMPAEAKGNGKHQSAKTSR